ncbi:MAG TPA: hypothetical protein VM345_17855 [Acidimicrobiales bacterium]|jgi:hypothetical protein|nr:hypothetical protein [Acidimicrobiales bacterium]
MNAYAGNPDADLEAQLFEPGVNDPANGEYRQRFAEWAAGR